MFFCLKIKDMNTNVFNIKYDQHFTPIFTFYLLYEWKQMEENDTNVLHIASYFYSIITTAIVKVWRFVLNISVA